MTQSPSILLVDDEATNLRVATSMLAERGYKLYTAPSGEIALERVLAIQPPPDLILLDVKMPGIDGFETCRRLKADERTKKIPVIFITALSDVDDVVQGFQVGGEDYVVKPVRAEELLARVDTRLRLYQLQNHLEEMVQEKTAQLQTAYERLARLERAKDQFIAVASHELRTPISIASGYAEMLMQDITLLNETYMGLVKGVKTGVDRIYEVVDAMVEMGRIDDGSLSPHLDTIALGAVLDAVFFPFVAVLRERGLIVATDGIERLPLIQADPELLKRAFSQLIGNAIKYTPDGGKITVAGRLIREWNTDCVEIAITDTGIGIDPAQNDLIFEKFYQTGDVSLHSSGRTKFKGGGPGLGLPIARGIIESHGGRIWMQSAGYDEVKCPGSTFYVLLPIQRDTQTPAPAPLPPDRSDV